MGETDHANGGGKQKQQPASGFRAIETQRQPRERERREKRGDGAGQTRGGFADAEELEADSCAPIKKRRLFEPGFSVETRSNPVAALKHVAGNPGVARLVWPDEAYGAEMAEVADVKRYDDQNGPADSGRGTIARGFEWGSGGIAHGKWSLTLNYYLQARDLLHTVARRLVGAAAGKR